MKKNALTAWMILSVSIAIAAWIWSRIDKGNSIAISLFFLGWISSLLAVGYYSTPSNSIYGKVAFGFVILTVVGIVLKVLHLQGADLTIICGLCGIGAAYLLIWIRTPREGNVP